MDRPQSEKLNAPSDFVTTPAQRRGAGLGCIPTVPSTTSDPWLAVAQFQQEILELRRENHRILLQYRDNRAVRLSVDREELGVELSRCRAELTQSQNEQETLRKKLADLQRQRVTERESWQTELHSSRQEAECLKGEVQEQSLRLGEHMRRERELQQHLDDMTSKHQTQLQHLNESHSTEVASLNQTIGDLQNRLSKSTLEVSSLKGCLEDTSSERDELRDQLSQLKNNLASQSETLQNLRNYIATLAAERGAEDQLSDKVKRLEKEKEALQLSVELLNVRVKSVNDILAIQEKELGEQYDTVLKGGSKSTHLLRLWREKVFALLVQLRSRDTQLRAEQRQLHNMVYALEEEVEGLRSQNSVLKNSLQDRTAQLELQVLQTQAVQQELSSAIEQKDKLKQKNQTLETSLSTITETIHRLSAVCEERAGLMNSALSHLSGLGQRLIFATKRLDTVHGLLVRREALRKVQQATKPPGHDPSESCINDLKAQVALLSEERDKLAQELKKTPELIHNALSDLQQQRDREVGRLTEALAQSREELEKCEAGRVQAHTQCEQLEGTITELRTEALHLQQHSARVLQERLSEVEKTCTKQLRDLESQLNTARREHTKTV
ncbi:coiled-coil alpha-helical rod protein 1 [Chanos chanos]|uniref:Coiled-coil alpha-helical rod protein 1 n=1 Tax=Chanos chanos TaxID=29144 RepID=A0A6J2W0Q2_CHACN|nr:coiled-coil alpha-helical rod protein 1 [Chanos chanos]